MRDKLAEEFSKSWNLEYCAFKSFQAGWDARQPEIEELQKCVEYFKEQYYLEVNKDEQN
jgi:hypothetical protein